MNKIVFVGQTPPPFGGQAIMIEKVLHGNYDGVKLYHVRLAFSKEMNQIGKANLYKIFHLIYVISKIYYFRIFKNAKTLYYPPAGPDKVPVIRDIVILISTRWLFSKIIFHFHAGGLSEMRFNSAIFGAFFKLAYFHADCAVLLSKLNPQDGINLKAKNQIIVPYGIEDYTYLLPEPKPASPIIRILFVSVIRESKGILMMLEAARQLRSRRFDFTIEIMGKFESNAFEKTVKNKILEYGLKKQIIFLGVLSGRLKFQAFKRADIFCFPTFFESETFGVVLLEAMQFSLPVVASSWRGIPSIVKDGVNGFLVTPKNPEELAKKLEILMLSPEIREKMGNEGRAMFLASFTLKEFQMKMGNIFRTC